jgi:hypothetical protein
MREEGEVLKDEAHAALFGRDVRPRPVEYFVAQMNLTGVGTLEACNQAQCSRLAAAARAQQGENLSLPDRESQVIYDGRGAGPKPLCQTDYGKEVGHGSAVLPIIILWFDQNVALSAGRRFFL